MVIIYDYTRVFFMVCLDKENEFYTLLKVRNFNSVKLLIYEESSYGINSKKISLNIIFW
jgi:hypothetical protein